MSWWRRGLNVFRQEGVSSDLDRELDFHIAERADELQASGMSEEEALREARRRLGNYTQQKERTWDVDVLGWLERLVADVRYALRTLRSNPGFATVAILSLALGIGANTAMFSLIDAVILKKLPVRDPDALVQILTTGGGDDFSNPLWEALHQHQTALAGVAAIGETRFNLSRGGEVRYAEGALVSGGFFDLLGVRAAAGRLIALSDDHRGCAAVAVLSNGMWQREYGGAQDALGRSISLNGRPYEIIGVAERSFFGVKVGRSVDVYIPICTEEAALRDPTLWFLNVIGRLKPDMAVAAANGHLQSIAQAVYAGALERADPNTPFFRPEPPDPAATISATPIARGLSPLRIDYSKALVVLMVLVAVVLLITCANVANLLLARSSARQREIAVRLSIGASRLRVIRQLMTESIVLALLSSIVSVLLALWGSRALVMLLSTSTSRVSLDLSIDARMLLFTLGAATIATLIFGAAPAWRAGFADPQKVLRSTGRGITGRSRLNPGKLLVIAQVGLSLPLIVAAGLLLGTLRKLTSDTGYTNAAVHFATLNLPGENERQRTVFDNVLERIRQTPGIDIASASQLMPLARQAWNGQFFVDGYQPPTSRDLLAFRNEVTDDYFATIGTRLLAGRDFDARDRPGTQLVAIVNTEFADHFYGTSAVVGRRFRVRSADGPEYEIIGVVQTARHRSLREKPERVVYTPWSQARNPAAAFTIAARGGTAPQFMNAMRTIARTVDPSMSLQFGSLNQQVAESTTRERILAFLSAAFGILALVLAVIGLYGIMAYNVARRRNEIGLRIALGSARARVVRLILGDAVWVLLPGLVLGLALIYTGIRFLESFLFGIAPTDPVTWTSSAAILLLVGLAAAGLPAWRASRVQPMAVLREE